MGRIVLDSSIIIDLFRNNNSLVVNHFDRYADNEVITTSVSVGEIFAGLSYIKSQRKTLIAMDFFEKIKIIDYDYSAAIVFGDIYAMLKRKGSLVDIGDMQIAAICLQHNLSLATLNAKHFQRIDDLKVEDWSLKV